MRDLTDYFASTSKKGDVNISLEIVEKETETITEATAVNFTKNVVNKAKNVHTRKKKKKRKPSDPLVKNMPEMFSTSLSIISPNNSFSNVSEVVECKDMVQREKSVDEGKKNCSVSVSTNKGNVEKTSENTIMFNCDDDSKICPIIKSEVPSSSLQYTSALNEDSQTSSNTPNAFNLMMESRNKSIGQNSPGKELVEDERIDVNKDNKKNKLSARKNLLENWAERRGSLKRKRIEEDKDEIINFKLKKRATRLKRLLRVNELGNVAEDSNKIAKRRIRVLESSSESSKESVENIEYFRTNTSRHSLLEIAEEDAQDKVIKNNKKPKENRQNLLSFFGILNKPNDSKEQENNVSLIKIKNVSEKRAKMNSNISLKKVQNEQEFIIGESTSDNLIASDEKRRNRKQKKTLKKSSHIPCTEKSVNQLQTSNDSEKIIGKNSIKPRSFKTWKMKIKLSTEESEQTNRNREAVLEKIETKTDKMVNDEILDREKNATTQSEEIVSIESEDEFVEKRRSKRICSKPVKLLADKIISSEDENDSEKKSVKKIVKVAPIFLKTTPKPKLAPEVIEARRQFLMSGIPLSLKKTLESQQSMEEREYDIFPSISHVQQKCDSPFWTLTKPKLCLKTYMPLRINQPASCSHLTTSSIPNKSHIDIESRKVDKIKTVLNKIKADNPNYPVYKSFRLIYEKSGKMPQQKHLIESKQKRKKKNVDNGIEIIDTQVSNLTEYTMWTEKYKAENTDDIIGNTTSIKSVKKWLEAWLKYSQDITVRKKQRHDSSSESEFDTTDCDSRDSTKLPGNTIILGGPCGSGKSTTVYAVCQELGYNVIELNASSKRTGKRLLQELQEATQSHQVRKNDETMQNFLQTKVIRERKTSVDSQKEKKMCVLLIEDIDLVFEQDDGFISAVTQLVTTSKRPIVMTTTDPSSVFVQRFICQYEYISFLRLSSQMLATWLQIVCLVEGLFVNRDDIGCLLEYNMGDVRKTLLELQFWVQSGGQLVRDEIPIKMEEKRKSTEETLLEDEPPLLFLKDDNKKREEGCIFVHSNCLGSFEIFRHHQSYSVPYYFNLGQLWWNIPNLLNITNFSFSRLNKFENSTSIAPKKRKTTIDDKIMLRSVENLYDSLTLTDIMFRKVSYKDGSEPNVKNYSCEIKDSLELGESMDEYNGHSDFVHQVTHTLINGYIEEYNSIEGKKSSINMALPDSRERRWRAKHHVCEDVFQEALSFSSYVERKSVALDYMPTLRNISRSEHCRASNNTKRGNRFRNYLRDLNVKCTEGTIKLACSMLRMNDD